MNSKVIQFRVSEKAHKRLADCRVRLRSHTVKPNLDMILNAILENMTLADFDHYTKGLVSANNARSKLEKMFSEGRITQEQMDELITNLDKKS